MDRFFYVDLKYTNIPVYDKYNKNFDMILGGDFNNCPSKYITNKIRSWSLKGYIVIFLNCLDK